MSPHSCIKYGTDHSYSPSKKGVFSFYSLVKPIYWILLVFRAGGRTVGVIMKITLNLRLNSFWEI